MKKALITGVTGQSGSYLAEFLLEKGYEVHGIKRRASSLNTQRVDHIYQDIHIEDKNFILHFGDLTDGSNLTALIIKIQPDEIYPHTQQPATSCAPATSYSRIQSTTKHNQLQYYLLLPHLKA